MLRDVRSNVTDGLLGFATATGDGLHIKIGVSPSVTEKPITILGSMGARDRKSTRLNSSHNRESRMPSSA